MFARIWWASGEYPLFRWHFKYSLHVSTHHSHCLRRFLFFRTFYLLRNLLPHSIKRFANNFSGRQQFPYLTSFATEVSSSWHMHANVNHIAFNCHARRICVVVRAANHACMPKTLVSVPQVNVHHTQWHNNNKMIEWRKITLSCRWCFSFSFSVEQLKKRTHRSTL